jgi:hypothetical protein
VPARFRPRPIVGPEHLNFHERQHWSVENRLHWVSSLGVPSLSHDVAPKPHWRAFATLLWGVVFLVAAAVTVAAVRVDALARHLLRDYPVLINR